MNLEISWNYAESVKKVSGLVSDLRAVTLKKSTLTDEIARELYAAREVLAERRPGKIDVTNVTSNTWAGYLSACGLERMTVHRWLEQYEPAEQRLLTDDEYQAKQEEKRRSEMSIRDANNSRVYQAIKTGAFPPGWNDDCQRLYDERVEEDRQRDERIKKMQDDMRRDAEQRQASVGERKSISDEIDSLIGGLSENLTKRAAFKERIRVSHEGMADPFVDAIMDYLDGLEDDNRRVEACYNIIKVCKGIANDLQKAVAAV